jgi:tRNA(Ile)-lysidine synthetase-like protein
MSSTIIDFWKENPKYWIPISEAEKKEADEVIYNTFYNFDYSNENIFGKVIYLDQFYRHFHRFKELHSFEHEELIKQKRIEAMTLIINDIDFQLDKADETELIFSLMPFKHLGDYEYVLRRLDERRILDNQSTYTYLPKVYKFFVDTYKKFYSLENITIHPGYLEFRKEYDVYNPDTICDYHPQSYESLDFESVETAIFPKELLEAIMSSVKTMSSESVIPEDNPLLISLSGGVDSMVMLAALVHLHIPVVAVHICYGNREESLEEYNFIIRYCLKLQVPIFGYKIEYIRRNNVEREFYEEMTRDIRFNVYKKLNFKKSKTPYVLLGHIQEDLIENVWTNLSKCQHLHNLKKMKTSEVMQGVNILRPFLNIQKDIIYKVSEELGIPYLKNSTPSWSNRGKFRTHFYKATHDQFGSGVDMKLLEVANKLEAQSGIIHKLLYNPIFKSFNSVEKTFDITSAIEAEISENEWCYIFEIICHKFLGISKPSIHSIRHFCIQCKKNLEHKFVLTKDLNVRIQKDGDRFLLMIL